MKHILTKLAREAVFKSFLSNNNIEADKEIHANFNPNNNKVICEDRMDHNAGTLNSDNFVLKDIDSCDIQDSIPENEDFYDTHEILGNIGSGAFGAVFKAVRLETLNVVAVKCVLLKNGNRERALREFQIMQALQDCPLVVRLHECFHTSTCLILVMDYYPQALDEIEIREKCDSYILRVFLDIQAAVSFLHEKLIAHRDIKPANILMTENTAILADFGCSLKVESNKNIEKFVIGRAGTNCYMSPEVIRNNAPYSALKADVWSVGCIIYFLLTGEDLFGSNGNWFTKVEQHTHVEAQLPPEVANSSVVQSLQQSMKSALQYTSSLRPPICLL